MAYDKHPIAQAFKLTDAMKKDLFTAKCSQIVGRARFPNNLVGQRENTMTVSIASFPPQIDQRYNAKFLSTPEHNLIHQLFATPVELPDNQGFIDRQSRYDRLDLFEVPLDDGQNNPPPQQLNRVDVDCRVRVYATYIVLTRQVTITNEDPVLNSAAARLGQTLKKLRTHTRATTWNVIQVIIYCVGEEMAIFLQRWLSPTSMMSLQSFRTTLESTSRTSWKQNSLWHITDWRRLRLHANHSYNSYLYNMTGFIKKFQYPNISQTLSLR